MTEQALLAPAPDLPPPSVWALLKEDVHCVFARDPAARSVWEVVTTHPGVHALLLHRLVHALWGLRLRYPARLLAFLARLLTNIDIHPGARVRVGANSVVVKDAPADCTTEARHG